MLEVLSGLERPVSAKDPSPPLQAGGSVLANLAAGDGQRGAVAGPAPREACPSAGTARSLAACCQSSLPVAAGGTAGPGRASPPPFALTQGQHTACAPTRGTAFYRPKATQAGFRGHSGSPGSLGEELSPKARVCGDDGRGFQTKAVLENQSG